MAAAADARAAALFRSRVVARGLVHAAQLVGLAVLLRAFADFTWAAAAAPSILRFAAAFLSPQRLCFLAANGIVIALVTIFLHQAASPSPSPPPPSSSPDASGGSPSANGDAEQHPLLAFLDPPPPLKLLPITEAEPSGEEVFEDKEAVHVKTVARAQPPRRTMSEKTRGDAACRTSATMEAAAAASPELRRAKSENGRRRQRQSAAAAAAAATAPVELGMDDAEAFRQVVEAFIAKQQTWFHREESLVVARAAASGGTGCGEDGRAAVAVK